MSIAELKVGEIGQVIDVAQLDESFRRRLADMGLNQGKRVKIQQKLPFAGPCILECEGIQLGLRHDDAQRIKVRVD
ncbi:FeoA family protein [Rubeoparvulum massiliense]|uniref:FeoA family protein n=1 Tax=Rubeoparvulum massiliense TaxID=1631346 RepID=UPI00065DF880|nr:FeoA family protein [Rubeoparvulum massiliense]